MEKAACQTVQQAFGWPWDHGRGADDDRGRSRAGRRDRCRWKYTDPQCDWFYGSWDKWYLYAACGHWEYSTGCDKRRNRKNVSGYRIFKTSGLRGRYRPYCRHCQPEGFPQFHLSYRPTSERYHPPGAVYHTDDEDRCPVEKASGQ